MLAILSKPPKGKAWDEEQLDGFIDGLLEELCRPKPEKDPREGLSNIRRLWQRFNIKLREERFGSRAAQPPR